jgi:cytochrome P450
VLRDSETYSSANALRPFSPLSPEVDRELAKGHTGRTYFILLDGEEHRRLRGPAASGVASNSVDVIEPYIRHRAGELIDAFAGDGHTEFISSYADRLPVNVIGHYFGFDPTDHVPMGRDSRTAASIVMGHRFASDQEQIEAARAWVRTEEVIARYLTDRRDAPRDDLTSTLLAAYAPGTGPLSPQLLDHLVALLFGVYLPGHITTSAILGNGIVRLLSHPDQWRLLCERPELIPNAVEEIARYDTPTHVFRRVTTRETVLAGHTLPAGTELAVWLAAANRDEDAIDRAEEFDITRPPRTGHVVFGHGAHFCPGAALARREVEITLRLLTERLPTLRLAPDQTFTYRPSLDHRGPLAVHLEW